MVETAGLRCAAICDGGPGICTGELDGQTPGVGSHVGKAGVVFDTNVNSMRHQQGKYTRVWRKLKAAAVVVAVYCEFTTAPTVYVQQLQLVATVRRMNNKRRNAPTCAGLMKARRPGVSAVLLDEYDAGVSSSSSTSTQSALVMSSLPHASRAISCSVAPAPRLRSTPPLLRLLLA
jgi:hypothetical protein